ncbi:MAG: AAA family ATPase [Candidatus Nomurabacteria bacterium]|nr:MAG: AAA family ATPase [Candidatus Nomurabacteria bacterium]
MKLPQIVGISGTNGAGKDELGKLLEERCGYSFHSVSELLREELIRTGQSVNRENQAELSKKWRNESGDNGIMFTKAMDVYFAEKDAKNHKGLALVSIRHPDEVKRVHERDGIVVWVDADQRMRYDRLQQSNRGRDEDRISFEQFKIDEYREMHPPTDAPSGSLDMKSVRELVDVVIENDFLSLDAYRDYLIKEFEL